MSKNRPLLHFKLQIEGSASNKPSIREVNNCSQTNGFE